MFPIHKGMRVTVIGLGLHGGGVGTVLWLLGQGVRLRICDLKSKKELTSSVTHVRRAVDRLKKQHRSVVRPQWELGRVHTRSQIIGAELVVVNPDVSRSSPVFRWVKTLRIPMRIGDTSIFIEHYTGPIIGVTGTRGKTTTTSIIGDILRQDRPDTIIGGNLRISPLQFFPKRPLKKQPPFAVLELSSWQVEGLREIERSPHIAVITNVFPDHLNRYRSMAEYARAKSIILERQGADDHAVLNYDQPIVRKMATRTPAHVWWVSGKALPKQLDGAFEDRGILWIRAFGVATPLARRNDLRVQGDHMVQDLLFAISAATAAGVAPTVVQKVITRFTGVWGRDQVVRTVQGVTFINDTAATIPEATVAALQTHTRGTKPRTIVLIAGGADKKLSYTRFVRYSIGKVKAIILFEGTASNRMLAHLRAKQKHHRRMPTLYPHVRSMAEAVRIATEITARGDRVLLSPAAASFGIFKHAYDRGEQFERLVNKL